MKKKFLLSLIAVLAFAGILQAAGTSSPIVGMSYDYARRVVRAMLSTGEEAQLAEYETGTWSPVGSSLTNLTGTASVSSAKWVRNGKLVTAFFAITGYSVTSNALWTNFTLTSTGLPGTYNNPNYSGVCGIQTGASTSLVTAYIGAASGGSSVIFIGWMSNGTGTIVTNTCVFQYTMDSRS